MVVLVILLSIVAAVAVVSIASVLTAHHVEGHRFELTLLRTDGTRSTTAVSGR